MISLLTATYRPGGLDIFAESLVDVRGDYEVVIIDDCPGRVARGLIPPALVALGVPLGYYGHSKPKSLPGMKCGLANAMNTGLMHCRGDYVVFVCDYTWLPKNWLSTWQSVQTRWNPRSLVCGSAIMYDAPKPTAANDLHSWPDGTKISSPKWPWVPHMWESFYVGFPMDWFEEINGVDERSDHCHTWSYNSMVAQSEMLGYALNVIPEICCHMIDHRVWDHPTDPAPPGCGGEGMWRITEAQSAPEEPKWQARSPNSFDLKAIRESNGVRARK